MKLSDEKIQEQIDARKYLSDGESHTTHLALTELRILRKLQEYTWHNPGCKGVVACNDPDCEKCKNLCTCGLSALLKELEGV